MPNVAQPDIWKQRVPLKNDQLQAFCDRWGVREIAFFGSVLREDFRDDSDLDVLLTLRPGVVHGFFDWITMTEQLEALFGRTVQLVSRKGVQMSNNAALRASILESAEVVHVAG